VVDGVPDLVLVVGRSELLRALGIEQTEARVQLRAVVHRKLSAKAVQGDVDAAAIGL